MLSLQKAWYESAAWLKLMKPLSSLFGWLAARRRAAYQDGRRAVYRAPVPVIIVGNITVGGTGKTPLVIELLKLLKNTGYKPGVVSRGYGSRAAWYPFLVTPESTATQSGDEALLIAKRSACPVMIDADRPAACRALLNAFPDCDLIISDDGLQHYALARDLEIVVLDAVRGVGNGYLLPAGPLREPSERLGEVDFVMLNGTARLADLPATFNMTLLPQRLVSLKGTGERPVKATSDEAPVHAVAGIGHPQRFFASLSTLGFAIIEHEFPDHHHFQARDLVFGDELDIVMTEKDAVKCSDFAPDNSWYLEVSVWLDQNFTDAFLARVNALDQRESPSTGTTDG